MIPKTKVVLMADDDEDDRLFLTEALLKVDPAILIVQAESGVELVQIIEQEKFEGDPVLIVLDMNMPSMNGLETLTQLKSKPNIAKIPAIMLSTASDARMSELARKAGFVDYFVKPHLVQGFLALAGIIKSKYLG